MLKETTQPGNPPRQYLAHISLALAGLMWVFPFLHPRHQYPLTTFYQEWWSAFLGLGAMTLLASRASWENPGLPRIVLLPVGLAILVLVQMALDKMAYLDQGLLYLLYFLFAAMLMMLGAQLRERFGIEQLALVMAGFLLVGAELNTLIGVLQHFRWHTPFDTVVVMKISTDVYGNLAQRNHYADYIALGLASLGLLLQRRALAGWLAALLASPMLLVLTLSGSRSSWLYLILMCLLAWTASRRDAGLRPLLRYSLLLVAGFLAMHLVVQLPTMKGAAGSVDTVQRMFGEDATGGIRLTLWREAMQMFAQSPWLGQGFGQFAWNHFQILPSAPAASMQGLYNNAHNIVFQIAVEAGLAGLVVLLGSLGLWLWARRSVALDAAHWWGYAVLGVLGLHSLLEYPLWYTYFVGIGALLLGALDETRYRLELRNVGRLAIAAMLLLGAMTLVQLKSSYQQLEGILRMRPASAADFASATRIRDGLVELQRGSLLSPYAELFMSSLIEVSEDRLPNKLELNTKALRFIPIGSVAYRQALLLALDGKAREAEVAMERAICSYPGELPENLRRLEALAAKQPERFAALLEFTLRKQQEQASAVYHQ